MRVRGGNLKFRALRLESGNFAFATENCTRKTRILDTVYNASNNELVRTKTLVKNTIVQIDATPFKQWYLKHYGVDIGKKKNIKEKTEKELEVLAKSKSVQAKLKARYSQAKIDPNVMDQFTAGRILCCISSRPGQSGRCDGYVLEGNELAFYKKKLEKKKKN